MASFMPSDRLVARLSKGDGYDGSVPALPSLSIVGETPENEEIVRVEKELSP